MSILNGLKSTSEVRSSKGNLFNNVSRTRDISLKTSSVYACGSKQYSYGSNYDQVARFPINNKNIDLTVKPLYTYSVICKDATTDSVVNPNLLNFEVVSINGSYHYTTNKNTESFNMIFENIPNDKIIKITLKITGSNYLETFSQIISNPDVSLHIQEIGLVNIGNPPSGVGVINTTISQGNNGTTQQQIVSVPASSSKYESASFTLPSGTKFYDKDGNKLNGAINVTIGHFSPTNQNALDLFNTGWTISNIVINDRELKDNESIEFVSAGFFTLDITDSSGKRAYSINEDLSKTGTNLIVGKTTINPTLINPETQRPFVVGDTMPYWRLDVDGLWKQESTAVVKSENGVLVMEFTTSGFSKANLDSALSCTDANGQVRTTSGASLPPAKTGLEIMDFCNQLGIV